MLADGSAVGILQSRAPAAGSTELSYSLALYSTADLSYLTCSRFSLAVAALAAGFQGHLFSLHCSRNALAVCYDQLGTRVHPVRGHMIGQPLFFAAGFTGVSWNSGYLAGVRDSAAEVLEGDSGRRAMRWQGVHASITLRASEAAWGGLQRTQLHGTSSGQGWPLVWSVLSI